MMNLNINSMIENNPIFKMNIFPFNLIKPGANIFKNFNKSP